MTRMNKGFDCQHPNLASVLPLKFLLVVLLLESGLLLFSSIRVFVGSTIAWRHGFTSTELPFLFIVYHCSRA